jgi:hypothetical protein
MTMTFEPSADWRMLMEATLIPPAERLESVELPRPDRPAAESGERPLTRVELAALIKS